MVAALFHLYDYTKPSIITKITKTTKFTKATKDNVTVDVVMNQNTVKEIKNGDTVLVVNRDYTVGTNQITFMASYLDTLDAKDSAYALKVTYNPYGLEAPADLAPITTGFPAASCW